MNTKWCVSDAEPEDQSDGKAYGPFDTEDEAWVYANELYPEDGNGSAVVLPLLAP